MDIDYVKSYAYANFHLKYVILWPVEKDKSCANNM
jgi:hypothetical protein